MSDAEEAVYEHPTASDTIIEDAIQTDSDLLVCFILHVGYCTQTCLLLVSKHVNTLVYAIYSRRDQHRDLICCCMLLHCRGLYILYCLVHLGLLQAVGTTKEDSLSGVLWQLGS